MKRFILFLAWRCWVSVTWCCWGAGRFTGDQGEENAVFLLLLPSSVKLPCAASQNRKRHNCCLGLAVKWQRILLGMIFWDPTSYLPDLFQCFELQSFGIRSCLYLLTLVPAYHLLLVCSPDFWLWVPKVLKAKAAQGGFIPLGWAVAHS